MPLSIKNDIGTLLYPMVLELKDKFPAEVAAIDALVQRFHTTFDHITFGSLQDGTVCEMIDAMINADTVVTPELRRAIKRVRLDLFGQIIGNAPGLVRSSTPGESLVRNHTGATADRAPRAPRSKADIDKLAREYAVLAVFMGDEEAMEILCELGYLQANERPEALTSIASYLGTCEVPDHAGMLQGILALPDDILKKPTIFRKMHRFLVRHCYQGLLGQEADDLAHHEEARQNIRTLIQGMIDPLYKAALGAKPLSEPHRDLQSEVMKTFVTAAKLEIPPEMAKTVRDHEGKEWPLGSWRQRLAIATLQSEKSLYVGFEAGGGKTFTAFLAYMLQRKQRQAANQPAARGLFVLPKAVMEEVVNRVRPGSGGKASTSCYFSDPATAPTVGVIRRGMTHQQILEESKKDMVFCAYSMWSIKKKPDDSDDEEDGIPVHQILTQGSPPFTFVHFDEAHLLQGDKKYTRLAATTLQEIPRIYDSGQIMMTSATPAPGALQGLGVSLELLYENRGVTPDGSRRAAQQSGVHSAEVRLRLSGGKLFILDERDPWEKEVELDLYDLTPQEHAALQMIIDDETLPAGEKLHLLQLIIRNPKLMTEDLSMPWTSLERTKAHLDDLLCNKDLSSVLIAENMYSNLVLRADGGEEHSDMFFVALRQWCTKQNVDFYIIHGETSEDQRIEAFEQVARAKESGRKVVLLSQAKCLNLGIDLRALDATISLQWPYNSPDLYQLLRRMNRAGKKDGRFIVCCAKNTIEEGIKNAAVQKQTDVDSVIHGRRVARANFDLLMAERNDTLNANDERIARYSRSDTSTLHRSLVALRNVGTNGVCGFWERNEHLAEALIQQRHSHPYFDLHRATAALILELEKRGYLPPDQREYLDTSSFGGIVADMMARMSPGEERSFTSFDPHDNLVTLGQLLTEDDYTEGRMQCSQCVGAPEDISQSSSSAGTKNLVILQNLEQTSHSVASGDSEIILSGRIRAIAGAANALKEGGILIIPLRTDAATAPQRAALRSQLEHFGLEAMDSASDPLIKFSGLAKSQDNEGEPGAEIDFIVAHKMYPVETQDIRNSVAADKLVLTAPKVREQATTRARKYRRLPSEMPHGKFKIGNIDLTTEMHTEGRAEHIAHLQRLQEAVTFIRSEAATPAAFLQKLSSDPALQNSLQDRGIRCLTRLLDRKQKERSKKTDEPLAEEAPEETLDTSSPSRLAFCFTNGRHHFYPYDRVWGRGEKSNS